MNSPDGNDGIGLTTEYGEDILWLIAEAKSGSSKGPRIALRPCPRVNGMRSGETPGDTRTNRVVVSEPDV